MSYAKQAFSSGQILTADNMNYIEAGLESLDNKKQDKLISGLHIKTLNGQSLIGSGNITIEVESEGGGGWDIGSADEIPYGNYDYATVADALDSLLYKAITINSFSNNVGTREMGQKVTSVNLSWSFNKTPKTLTLDGESIDVKSASKSLTGLNITSAKNWVLVATDEKGGSASRSTGVSFANKRYWGVGTVDASGIDDAFVLGLSSELSTSKAKTMTVTANAGQYIYYCIPARFGTPVFYVGGFEGGFALIKTFDFTNASGYKESYAVWRSENHSLGKTEVTIK